MIITDLTIIERLAEEAYANNPIFSVDLADYANLKRASDYIKAAKLETPSLTKESFDKLSQLINEMGTDGIEEVILHITCNGNYSEDIVSQGTNMMILLMNDLIPNACVLYGISTKDSDESSFTILLLAGYSEKNT